MASRSSVVRFTAQQALRPEAESDNENSLIDGDEASPDNEDHISEYLCQIH